MFGYKSWGYNQYCGSGFQTEGRPSDPVHVGKGGGFRFGHAGGQHGCVVMHA